MSEAVRVFLGLPLMLYITFVVVWSTCYVLGVGICGCVPFDVIYHLCGVWSHEKPSLVDQTTMITKGGSGHCGRSECGYQIIAMYVTACMGTHASGNRYGVRSSDGVDKW